MTPQTIQVISRFTEVGQPWPIGAWVYVDREPMGSWFEVTENMYWDEILKDALYTRQDDEISESEANARGIFRMKDQILADAINFIVNIVADQKALGEQGDSEYISKGGALIKKAENTGRIRAVAGTPYFKAVE